jgi:esterase
MKGKKLINFSKIAAKTDIGAKPWVFLHGLLGSQTNYKKICKNRKISGVNDIYLVDMRNHGGSFHSDDTSVESMALDVGQFIDDLELGCVNILGHSLGGKVSLELSLTAPEKLNSMVLVDVGPFDYIKNIDQFDEVVSLKRQMENMNQLNFATMECREEVKDAMLETCDRNVVMRDFFMRNVVKNLDTGSFEFRINL